MALLTKCILSNRGESDGIRISVMSRHTLNDGITSDTRINSSCFDFHYPILAPSPKLIGDYYKRSIGWGEFETRFKKEMENPMAIKAMENISQMALKENVTLLCIEDTDDMCHRRLLVELINKNTLI